MRTPRPSPLVPLLGVAALAPLLVGACCPAKPTPVEPEPSAAATAAPVAPPAPAKATTVIVFVIDQLPSWALDKYLPHLPADGVLRRGVDTGVYAERVAYPFASTNTAPGHAAIFTGQPPSVTGITTNERVDPGQGERSVVDDGKHRVLGSQTGFASPTVLRVPTVGDALHDATGGAASIVAVSGKDRAAVISGGQRADHVLWYSHGLPGFTTSTFYADALPAPLASWLTAHPIDSLLTPWSPERPELYAELVGADDGPGEGDWLDFRTSFPHDAKATKSPYSVLRLMPQLTEYMLELTAEVAAHAKVGEDDVPDLVIASISGTDYTGHTFGASSWEYLDHLVRADRAMAKLVSTLSQRGPVRVLVTSDHGVARLPEKSKEGGARVFPDAIEQVAEAAASAVLGEGDWVWAFSRPFVYLSPTLDAEQRGAAESAIIAALGEIEGVAGVFPVEDAKTWRDDPDPTRRAVGLSVAESVPGDLYVLASRGAVIDENRPRGKGTTHGTQYDYDQQVPVIFFGEGISRARLPDVLPQERVAPTISALLGVPPPKGVTAAPLPGASR